MEKLEELYNKYQNHIHANNSHELKHKIVHEYNKHINTYNEIEQKSEETIENLADTFNTVLINISLMLKKEYKNDIKITLYYTYVENLIQKKKKEAISLFLIHIYKNDEFRQNILEKNDDFFLDDSAKYDKIINGDKIKIAKLFEFKNIWVDMNEKLKEYIRNSCITMINISELYIKEKADLHLIHQIKELKHP